MNIIKKINQERQANKNQIWLCHITVIVIVFLSSYIPNIDFVIIPRIISSLYLFFCLYFCTVSFSNKRKTLLKFLYVLWPIGLHSLVFLSIEIEEMGLTFFTLLMISNVLLCMFSFLRKQDSSGADFEK